MGGIFSTPNIEDTLQIGAAIPDMYKTIEEVQAALRRQGLESCNLIFGIDFTKSNKWNGKQTFFNQSLHHIDPTGRTMNPYQQAMSICARTLEDFDDDHLIPCFGFGDTTTTDRSVFPFNANGQPCYKIDGVLKRYKAITKNVNLSGPTSFAPIINKAIEIVQQTRQYHILVIIADGQINDNGQTQNAIIRASNYPLSIVTIGVGDGPWKTMEHFDDSVVGRRFDNFQFVNFHEVMNRPHVEN